MSYSFVSDRFNNGLLGPIACAIVLASTALTVPSLSQAQNVRPQARPAAPVVPPSPPAPPAPRQSQQAPAPSSQNPAAQNPAAQNPTPAPTPPPASVGGGDVNLTPKRVVLQSGRNAGEIIVFNRGLGSGNYNLTLDDRVMTEEGGIKPWAEASETTKAAAKPGTAYIRISPRRVTLSPNGVQTVRVSGRVPPEAPDGEYRSHFTVVAAPEDSNGLTIDDAAGPIGPGEIRVRVVPRFGISIPIIVRKGVTNVTAGIENLRIAPGPENKPAILFTITREGNRSVFGDFEVFATVPGGPRVKIGEVKGVAVYPEINRRDVIISLITPDAPPPAGAVLEAMYKDDDFNPGATLATAQAVVR
jgi:hypothetical protein